MIKPLKNYVLLEKEVKNEEYYGSIFLANNKKDDGNVAKIIALGEDVKSPLLKENAKVIYKEYSTTSYKENDKEYLLLEEKDILAVIE